MRTLTATLLLTISIVSTLSIANGGILYPDTISYANGHATWSSPLASLTGRYLSLTGLQLLSILSLLTMNYLIWRNTRDTPKRGLIVSILLSLGPWNTALGTAGADTLGTTFILLAGNRRPLYLPLASLGHLAAGLAGTLALLLRRNLPLTLIFAGTAEIIILRYQPFHKSAYPTELQWRYLLPGITALSLPSAELHLKESRAGKTLQRFLDKAARERNTEGAGSHRPGFALEGLHNTFHSSAKEPAPVFTCQDPEGQWIAMLRDEAGRRD